MKQFIKISEVDIRLFDTCKQPSVAYFVGQDGNHECLEKVKYSDGIIVYAACIEPEEYIEEHMFTLGEDPTLHRHDEVFGKIGLFTVLKDDIEVCNWLMIRGLDDVCKQEFPHLLLQLCLVLF